MSAPPKTAAHPDVLSSSDSDEPPEITPEATLAADDPTAVWDADSLREAGLDELADAPEQPAAPPATRTAPQAPPSIVTPLAGDGGVVEEEDATEAWDGPPLPQLPTRSEPASQSSGWGATLALALTLGTAVYFAVRFLK